MVVGMLRVEPHLPWALSLKDKRSVLKSLKDQMRGRFNVAVSELDPSQKWQRASLRVATVGGNRQAVEGCLRHVVEWMQTNRFIELIRVEQEFF